MSDLYDSSPPCPTCGAENGMCAPVDADPDPVIFPPPIQPEHNPVATVLVPHDVIWEVPGVYPGQSRTALRYAKGTRITPEQARECGLLPIESGAGPVLEHKT